MGDSIINAPNYTREFSVLLLIVSDVKLVQQGEEKLRNHLVF